MSPPTTSGTSHVYDLVCIGSGPAGQRAAVQAAKLGKRVAVVDRGPRTGGTCLETGTIPSKTFREAVRAACADREMAMSTSLGRLFARVGLVQSRESKVIRDQLWRNGIDVIHGSASFVGPHRMRIDEGGRVREIEMAHALLAVGTSSAQPDDIEFGDGVVVSDDLLGVEQMPRSVAVIGAGVIGVEYASMFAALGAEVVVVDRRPRPLEFMDEEIVDELIHDMRERRVRFCLGETVKEVRRRDGEGRVVVLASGKRVVADLLLYSVGRVGNTAGLGLESAGLCADDRGRVTVDACFRTAVPHIYAAGDVVGFPALAATSAEQGRIAACHMFGLPVDGMQEHFPFGIYSIPEMSMVGRTEASLTKDRVPYESGVARFRETARGQILGEESGMLKMLFHRETRALLGVHIVGTGATELVHIGQAAMVLGGGLDYFLTTVFNYPTLAEAYKVAALAASNKLRASATMRPAA